MMFRKQRKGQTSMTRLSGILLATGLFVLSSTYSLAQQVNNSIKSYEIEGSYEDALFDLGEALTNKGLVIDNRAKVANMLNRTAKDVGAKRTVYKNGEVLEFCSAILSRRVMEADPLNMAFCPYSMFVYETTAKPGFVTIGYHILDGATNEASKKALGAVNKLMDDMVREAAGLE